MRSISSEQRVPSTDTSGVRMWWHYMRGPRLLENLSDPQILSSPLQASFPTPNCSFFFWVNLFYLWFMYSILGLCTPVATYRWWVRIPSPRSGRGARNSLRVSKLSFSMSFPPVTCPWNFTLTCISPIVRWSTFLLKKGKKNMEYMNDKVINLMTKKAYDCAMLLVKCLNLKCNQFLLK